MRFFLSNGLFYYLNNQMNFLVLEKVDAVSHGLITHPPPHPRPHPHPLPCPHPHQVTHGLINCGRRVANIAFAIVWFRVPVTIFNGIGMALALFGTFSYMRAKQQVGIRAGVRVGLALGSG